MVTACLSHCTKVPREPLYLLSVQTAQTAHPRRETLARPTPLVHAASAARRAFRSSLSTRLHASASARTSQAGARAPGQAAMSAAVRALLLGSLLVVAHAAPLGTVYHANVTVFSTNALVRGKLRSPPKRLRVRLAAASLA